MKTALFDHRLTLDAAVYNIDWRKIQVTATQAGFSYTVNGGKANSRGFEGSAVYSPVAGLRLGFAAAYTDATLSENVPSIGGLDGDRLPYAPKWSG